MSKFEVVPHERIASEPVILKKMLEQVIGLSLAPQEVNLPTNHALLFVALKGWKLGLWFEVRPPFNPEQRQNVIYQLFTDGDQIPSYAAYRATVLREEIGDVRIQQPVTAYHLFEFPRGSKIRSLETGEVSTHD